MFANLFSSLWTVIQDLFLNGILGFITNLLSQVFPAAQ